MLKAAAGFVVAAALTTIIGNRADAVVEELSPWAGDRLGAQVPIWAALAVGLFVIGVCLLGFARWQERHVQVGMREVALRADRAEQLIRMNDSLIRLLARLGSGTEIETQFIRVLEEYLRDATGVFGGDVTRGMILLRKANRLRPFAGFQMPSATMKRTEFGLTGTGLEARGVAAVAFLSGEPRVVHIEERDGRFVSDQPNDYIVFDPDRPHPPYRSFIVVAIPGSPERHGAICFDSMKVDAFDAPEIQSLVANMALQVGSAIEIYERMAGSLASSK